jgi:uncharacterized protein
MSNTTPGPDETPADPTAPPVDQTAPASTPQPAYAQPQPEQPQYAQPQYAQPGYAQQLPPAYPPPGTAVAGPTPMTPSEERTTGMASHGVALAATVLSGGLLGFVAALVMYLVFRDRGPFVRHHSANALNVQIIAGIVMLISLPLMIILVGFVTFAAAWVFAVIVHIVGMVKANNGEWYNPPLTPQFVK